MALRKQKFESESYIVLLDLARWIAGVENRNAGTENLELCVLN